MIFLAVIVGSSTLSREELTRGCAGFRVVASRPSVAKLFHDAPAFSKPGLLIIDAGNDSKCAVSEIADFKGCHFAVRVGVIADRIKLDAAVSAFRASVNAHLFKGSTGDTFIKLPDLVIRGETILLAGLLSSTECSDEQKDAQLAINERRVPKNSLVPLQARGTWVSQFSAREKCVLRCLILGDSNKVIARKMDIAEATIKVYIKAILRKSGAHNRTQAAIWAMNNAL